VENQEPWRIDRESIHWKILNGWLTESFEKWLEQTANKYRITEKDLLLGIAESIRKISYQTILILKEQTGQETLIPPFIISPNPGGEIAAISLVILNSDKPDSCFNRLETFEEIGPFVCLAIMLQEIRETMVRISGGLVTLGSANDILTAYHYVLVEEAINDYLTNQRSDNYYLLIRTVIEETLHYFDWQNNQTLMKQFFQEEKELTQNISDFDEKFRIGQELEEKYGFKKRVREIFEILKNKEDLFSPLLERIKKDASS
jgi:hypothetical protein